MLGTSIFSGMSAAFVLALASSRRYPYECIVYVYIFYIAIGLSVLMTVFVLIKGLLSKQKMKYLRMTVITVSLGMVFGCVLMGSVGIAGNCNLVHFFLGI